MIMRVQSMNETSSKGAVMKIKDRERFTGKKNRPMHNCTESWVFTI